MVKDVVIHFGLLLQPSFIVKLMIVSVYHTIIGFLLSSCPLLSVFVLTGLGSIIISLEFCS